jgi:hypothetical protein
MQTPFSPPAHLPELFTRERRRTRLRQFVASFENESWNKFSPISNLVPIKSAPSQPKAQHWTGETSP